MVQNKISKSRKDTTEIAKDFLKKISKSTSNRAVVVGLYGELGAGKTAFTQAAGRHLGVKNKMTSPTFVIMKRYPIKKGKHKFLYHLDAYRIKKEKELLNLGWAEVIADTNNLIFIEWPENVKKAMPKHHKIKIAHTKEGHRRFNI